MGAGDGYQLKTKMLDKKSGEIVTLGDFETGGAGEFQFRMILGQGRGVDEPVKALIDFLPQKVAILSVRANFQVDVGFFKFGKNIALMQVATRNGKAGVVGKEGEGAHARARNARNVNFHRYIITDIGRGDG